MAQAFGLLSLATAVIALVYGFWIFSYRLWPTIAGEKTVGPKVSAALLGARKHLAALACLFALTLSLMITSGVAQRIASMAAH